MKVFCSYLRQRRLALGGFAAVCVIFAGSFSLYRLPLRAVWYPAAICLVLTLAAFGADFCRVRRKHRQLAALQNNCVALLDALPQAEGVTEADYQALLAALNQRLLVERTAAAAQYQDLTEYYTVWVHQIKTPIASMRLMLQGEDSAFSRRLSLELLRIEQYVEMVLAYLRLDAPTSDYVLRACSLDEIVRRSARKFASEFIVRRLKLAYEPMELTLITDEKWLGFVIDQLLSNALKYTQEGGVRIYLDGKTLCIADTGIGIAPEDLPRIFEKGYTGYNGRREYHATGIGLYLCRRICGKLGISLAAISTLGEGTTLRLDLSQKRLQTE